MISPGLYNIYSEYMRCILEEHHDGITIGDRTETNLRFADDTTLLCTSKEELLVPLKWVKEASKSLNLLFNTQKTNIMVVAKCRERKEDFVLDGEKIEEVESFLCTQNSSEHGVYKEEQRHELGTQSEVP